MASSLGGMTVPKRNNCTASALLEIRQFMDKHSRYIPLAILVAVVALCACSTKKNTPESRFWQAFTTRYNVYHNGITHYNEQIKVLENDYEDDYSQRVLIHPAEAYSNPKAPQPASNFDRTIEKMQKAISLHSIKKKPKRKRGKSSDPKYQEWMKRDEYNPFLHNAWYTLAKSEYMKGDFLSAAATFHYIAKHFTWKPKLVQEANIWEALSYCAMGWTTEADNVLDHVHIEKIEDKRIRCLANLAFANYHLKCNRDTTAIPYLAEAVNGFGGQEKVRLNFLLGQLYAQAGQREKAYQAFKRAGSNASSTYRTKFNARIQQSTVFAGNDIKGEVNALRRMTRYDRNKEYLDQIYYAIGNLYLSRQDTAKAIENYVLAAQKSTRNGMDKAISQLQLGGIYFAQHKYDLAQPCYAEAIPRLSENYPNYKDLKRRSDVLDELAVYSQNVTLQDSLLRLSQLPLDEQKKVIKKIIDELKKKEKEEAETAQREAYLAEQNAKGQQNSASSNAPTTYTINSDKSWYFYNQATKAAGKTAFQQQWGSRKLEDNWRRRNKTTVSSDDEDMSGGDETQSDTTQMGNGQSNDSTSVGKAASKRADDPHYEEYYLKQIPKTKEEIQKANDVIQEGLYNEGVILKDKLEDYEAAAYAFRELLRRYPDNVYRLDTYYNMYLMCMRLDKVSEAETYRQLILKDFAESQYGMALKDPNYLENLKRMDQVQEQLYAEAYANYLANNNDAVHRAYDSMMRTYPLSKLMPKFMFIDALSYVTQRNFTKFKSTLKEMLQRYPDTDMTPTATSILKQVNQGRKLLGGGSNARGMLWDLRLGNDSTGIDGEDKQFTPFKDGMNKPQLFVLAFANDSVNSNALLYSVARHNFVTYKVRDFDLEQLSFGALGMLVVKGFNNFAELSDYRTTFDADSALRLPSQVHQVLISEENFNLLINEGRSLADYFSFLEGDNEQQVESQIPDEAGDDARFQDPGNVETDTSNEAERQEADKPMKSVRPTQKSELKQEEPVAEPKQEPSAGEPEDEQTHQAELMARQEALKAAHGSTPQPSGKTTNEGIRESNPYLLNQDSVRAAQNAPVVPENPALVVDDGTKAATKQPAVKQTAADTAAITATQQPAAADLKVRSDSLHRANKAQEKARKDSAKTAEKTQKERIKEQEKAKKEAKKQHEQELKAKKKAQKEAKKQRERERKERKKQQEEKRKAYRQKKAKEAKERKQAAEERKKLSGK